MTSWTSGGLERVAEKDELLRGGGDCCNVKTTIFQKCSLVTVKDFHSTNWVLYYESKTREINLINSCFPSDRKKIAKMNSL